MKLHNCFWYLTFFLVWNMGSDLIAQNPLDCNCVGLQLEEGKKYVVSAWVKEDTSGQVISYNSPVITIRFLGNESNVLQSFSFKPSGKIIDGWQRIAGQFVVPADYFQVSVVLGSQNDLNDVYYDDFRIQPFYSSMKTFVYDITTLRLMSELDDNNFATYYEYDKEGGLVRIKKETEKGVYTIQETRSKSAVQQ